MALLVGAEVGAVAQQGSGGVRVPEPDRASRGKPLVQEQGSGFDPLGGQCGPLLVGTFQLCVSAAERACDLRATKLERTSEWRTSECRTIQDEFPSDHEPVPFDSRQLTAG